MLDTETKKRIDSARDILVGKVPDPKSQVEQITIALIYKFMDDMDKEAVDFGGEPSFFTGEYEKYSWTKIFDPKLGGFDMLNLYSEALVKLNQNPAVPQLFRDIFKNAYLPYRDPETLKLFLKTINEFHYDHSERLGDSFEYLLSVLGSQGDAGQFRTPRHIIDFIVAVVDPKKGETIADPACGTAGFLISAYKHILSANTKKSKGDELTPADKKNLIQNFSGYDISPDMVRLSLVNMYLHGFTAPKVFEYDTLTSGDRWGETFDVVLANPPFMSPKGGIKPHKKFSIQANRSEALFLDYIAEHIHPVSGRAAVIVPEGVIFKSETAFKAIRKLLVDKHYLYAVVSLPAGVFQPYSGVKTSVLFMDKTVAKKSNSILFVKIEGDGFDLGAQRRVSEKNDLPDAARILKAYKNSVLNNEPLVFDDKNVLVVEKEKIKANADYNLSSDRYKSVERKSNTWEIVHVEDLCEVTSSKRIFQEEYVNEGVPFYRTKEIVELSKGLDISLELFISEERFKELKERFDVPKKGDLLVSAVGTIGTTWVVPNNKEFYFKDGNLIWIRNLQGILPTYLKFVLDNAIKYHISELTNGAAYNALTIIKLKQLLIPLPPLSIQQEIVSKIESYQRIIDGAKQVVEAYKPQIDIEPDWEMVELGEVCKVINGRAYKQEELLNKGEYPVLRVGNFFSNRSWYYSDLELDKDKYCEEGDLLYAWSASFGPRIWDGPIAIYHYHIWKLVPDEKRVDRLFLHHILERDTEDIKAEGGRGIAMIHITKAGMEKRIIPIPPLQHQKLIVERIEKEQTLVNANKELITLYEQKIKDEIAKLWQEDKKTEATISEQIEVAAEA